MDETIIDNARTAVTVVIRIAIILSPSAGFQLRVTPYCGHETQDL
jgi:hypothetical protein